MQSWVAQTNHFFTCQKLPENKIENTRTKHDKNVEEAPFGRPKLVLKLVERTSAKAVKLQTAPSTPNFQNGESPCNWGPAVLRLAKNVLKLHGKMLSPTH